jgi:DNA-damage-inducible protein J
MSDVRSPHDTWFRAKVREALDDPRPPLSNDEVEAHFRRRRALSLARSETHKP